LNGDAQPGSRADGFQRPLTSTLDLMNRTFLQTLTTIGYAIVAGSVLLAMRLVWEQTALSWADGPQMVGFSLMHTGLGIPLIFALYAGLLWAGAVLIAFIVTRSLGNKAIVGLLIAYGLSWAAVATPYGFWQRLFIEKFSPSQATAFFTYAAATGDLKTVEAFLDHGVDINTQGRYGTALHGAAVAGELEVMEYLIAHGANVNAVNAYGDSPLANAFNAKKRPAESQTLLAKHGGTLIRGSEEQRDRVIKEQVRKDIEKMDKRGN